MATDERIRTRRDVAVLPSTDGGNALEQTRREGDELLASGDTAVDRVLSKNSAEFLGQNIQTGAQ